MTTEMTMPRRGSGSGGLRLRAAVAAALVLSRLRPGRLRRVLARVSRGARPAGYEETLRVYEAVVATSRRCAGWYGCLPRSIAIALACRMSGVWPDWCVGVRGAPPFSPHAWVRAGGRAVGEQSAEDLRPLMTVTVCEGGGGDGDGGSGDGRGGEHGGEHREGHGTGSGEGSGGRGGDGGARTGR
ncbi:lasso peptide biosynthesis B2 protein [Streptomyces sp. TRM 70361]|uniref:lasso peptide biosynthesis B2 protein n=1 Tax=Streptomyces sp. TRM 70361 TaxID=3116553 RepID=UPI002E7B97CF|nr:lasso peptide biosynthesis B2 protein [Streptomyces sp. TRM 70361]MEE1938005.1 lasso peptide biosynthesis B2 protein [Streptomyces sp. TRM 70361]